MQFFNSTAKLTINPEYRRITLQPVGLDTPHEGRFLYAYKDMLFAYLKSPLIVTATELRPVESIDAIFENEPPPIYSHRASQQTIEPKPGKEAKESFYRIEIWSGVNPQYQDIFLMCELARIYHQSTFKKGQKPAREYARRKMHEYIEKHLTKPEQEALDEIVRKFPDRMSDVAAGISHLRGWGMEVLR